jgi:hypothetical protein
VNERDSEGRLDCIVVLRSYCNTTNESSFSRVKVCGKKRPGKHNRSKKSRTEETYTELFIINQNTFPFLGILFVALEQLAFPLLHHRLNHMQSIIPELMTTNLSAGTLDGDIRGLSSPPHFDGPRLCRVDRLRLEVICNGNFNMSSTRPRSSRVAHTSERIKLSVRKIRTFSGGHCAFPSFQSSTE